MQIGFDQVVRRQQPQYAAGDRGEQAHPDIEECRGDLVTVVETAEHQPFDRQSTILSRRAGACHLALSVVDLITAGKVDQLLRKERLLAAWYHERIDQDVVDESGPHG